ITGMIIAKKNHNKGFILSFFFFLIVEFAFFLPVWFFRLCLIEILFIGLFLFFWNYFFFTFFRCAFIFFNFFTLIFALIRFLFFFFCFLNVELGILFTCLFSKILLNGNFIHCFIFVFLQYLFFNLLTMRYHFFEFFHFNVCISKFALFDIHFIPSLINLSL